MFRPLAARLSRWIAGLPQPSAACTVCAAWPAQTFCDDCLLRFARPVHRCATCAIALPVGLPRCGACVRQPPPLDACLAAVDYGYPWDRSIAALKFRGEAGLARALAELLRRVAQVQAAIDSAELLLPMPLSALRLQERGFNQSALIARRLAPAKCDAATLLRIRHTAALSGMDRQARRVHVHGAFALEPARAHRLKGRRLLLIDDVMTSGATLHEAARVLRTAGAAAVSALVVARTPMP